VSYYYVVASLPLMFFGDPPPVRSTEWRRQLQGVLPEKDLVFVDAFLEGRHISGCRFADQWQAKETQLRNAKARARAAQLGVEVHAHLRQHAGYDMEIEDAVTNAYTKENPLERERELDRCRWHIAEQLAQGDLFRLETILAFAVKLRMAERWADMRNENGQQAVEEFVGANARWEGRDDPRGRPQPLQEQSPDGRAGGSPLPKSQA